MSTVPFSPSAKYSMKETERSASSGEEHNSEWMRFSAGGALLAGALLLLAGKRRAGLLATAAGATLTVLDQKDTVKVWWEALPGYLDTAQHMLDEAQHTIDDIAAKRDKVRSFLGGKNSE